MSFVEGLAGAVNHTLNGLVSRALDNKPKDKKSKSSSGSSEDYAKPNPGIESPQQRDNRKTYAKAPELMAQVRSDDTRTRVSGRNILSWHKREGLASQTAQGHNT